jgi:NAD-dependent SIR2 family protein deacetylase
MKCLICQKRDYSFNTLLQKKPNQFFEVCESCFNKTPLLLTVSSIPMVHELCHVYQYHVHNDALRKIYRLYEDVWLLHLIHLKHDIVLFIERLDEKWLQLMTELNLGRIIIVTPTLIQL